MRYTILLDWDVEGNEYAVSVPLLPGCFTHGPTVEIATDRAKEAIASYVASLVADGEAVPIEEPALIPLVVDVAVEAELAAPVATG